MAFYNHVQTLNVLPKKTSDFQTSLEVDRQTIHSVPKYGMQIRCKTGKNCSSLKVKTFCRFLVLTLHRNPVKTALFLK